MTAEISKISLRTQSGFSYAFNMVLEYTNTLVIKRFLKDIENVVTYRKKICLTIWDFIKGLVAIIWYS